MAGTSCSEPAEVATHEEAKQSTKATVADADFASTNTSEELAFLASRVCFPQVAEGTGLTVGDVESLLTGRGYTLASSEVSSQAFGRVVEGFVAAPAQCC